MLMAVKLVTLPFATTGHAGKFTAVLVVDALLMIGTVALGRTPMTVAA